WCDGQIAAEKSTASTGNHSISLLPLIDETLREASCSLGDVEAVAVSGGPGSFSGLRVGLSVAKGLAYATGIRVVAVPTLEALARTVEASEAAICALLDAHKGELYAAIFGSAAENWSRRTPDLVITPERLRNWLPVPCTVIGDATVSYEVFLREQF